MRAQAVGRVAERALTAGGAGTVVAASRHGFCVELPAGMVLVGGPDLPLGPLCVRLEAPPPITPFATPARAEGRHLGVGGLHLVWASAVVWSGRLPPPSALKRSAEGVARVVAGSAVCSALLSAPYAARTGEFHRRLRAGEVAAAANLVAGLGPGLTPAGDDLLAGTLFWLRACCGGHVEPRLLEIAQAAATTSLSRAFLCCAASGEWLDPAHALLCAVVTGNAQAAFDAAQSLAGIGGSSGRDFCLGLMWAAQLSARLADVLAVKFSRRGVSCAGG